MGQIRMTPEQMRTRAGQYKNEGQETNEINSNMKTLHNNYLSESEQRLKNFETLRDRMNNSIERMTQLLNQLQGEWEGEAARSYSDKFNQLKPGFQKVERFIEELKVQENKTKQLYNENLTEAEANLQTAEQIITQISTALNQNATTLEQADAQMGAAWRG